MAKDDLRLIVQYLRELSTSLTYLVLVVASLFLYLLSDLSPSPDISVLKTLLILVIIGGFILFGIANFRMRKIEKELI